MAEDLAQTGFSAVAGSVFTSRKKIEVQNMDFKAAEILNRAGVMSGIICGVEERMGTLEVGRDAVRSVKK